MYSMPFIDERSCFQIKSYILPAGLSVTVVYEHYFHAAVLLLLMAINCLGVRAGGTVQSGLMVLKILAIVVLVLVGWWFGMAHPDFAAPAPAQSASLGTLAAIGAAMTLVPVSAAMSATGRSVSMPASGNSFRSG